MAEMVETHEHGVPLAHCPLCDYSLVGLPATHRCPECGFAYDESMRILADRGIAWHFRRRLLARPAVPYGVVLGAGLALSILGSVLAYLVTLMSNVFTYSVALGSVVCLVLVLLAVAALTRRLTSGRFILLSREGLSIGRRRKGIHKHIPWAEVRVPPAGRVDWPGSGVGGTSDFRPPRLDQAVREYLRAQAAMEREGTQGGDTRH